MPETDPSGMVAAKAALRARMRFSRRALAPERRISETALTVEALIALLSTDGADHLASYAATGSELDLGGLHAWWRARGHPVWLPRVLPNRMLTWHAIDDPSVLHPGEHGIPEPDPSQQPAMELPIDAVVLMPGLAFDGVGGRLGQGGGYYDRLIDALWRRAIGIGFSCQRVASVPREPHDRLLARMCLGGTVVRAVQPA